MTTQQIAALPTDDKNALISARILYRIAEGMDPAEALDAVCGQGMFRRLADLLYDELRARVGL